MRSSSPLLLLANARVYNPEDLGIQHVLVGGSKILGLFDRSTTTIESIESVFAKLQNASSPLVKVVNVEGHILLPGLVDIHQHVTGGGGELGPSSRTPEAKLHEIIEGGITTVVGLLGTDSISRSLSNLYAKLVGLEKDGSYRVPPPTLTGSLQTDLLLIDKVIGVGEIAISDHRSSRPTNEEIEKCVGEVRVGGLLSGKCGKAYFHVGRGESKLAPLLAVVESGEIPITQMLPTHVSSRGPALLEESVKWIRNGGYVDVTADEIGGVETINVLDAWRKSGVDLSHVMASSDAYGSFPLFDESGETILSYDYGRPAALLYLIKSLILDRQWPPSEAIRLATSTPSTFLSLNAKGYLSAGKDADILIVNESYEPQIVIAKGELVMWGGKAKRGMFE